MAKNRWGNIGWYGTKGLAKSGKAKCQRDYPNKSLRIGRARGGGRNSNRVGYAVYMLNP